MTNLADPIDRFNIVRQIEADVDAFSIQLYDEGHRNHLGASEIGHPCSAKAWGKFRWLKKEKFSGRMLRLFKRGHFEEPKFIQQLRGIGFDFREFAEPPLYTWDGDSLATVKEGKQFRIVGCNGHFGGSLDGMTMAPARYGIEKPMLVEFKTHNEKSFTKLAGSKDKSTGARKFVTGTNGVRINKPVHFSQMCAYGRSYSFEYALYVAVNKDSDELYFEIVPLDWNHADDLFRKAASIIASQEQPGKIAQTETFFECKYCDLVGICHRGELPEKNCRSCIHALPIEGGQWFCDNEADCIPATEKTLSKERIASGCDDWKAIINGA